ncbi:hypothetical protein BD770DRAFT_440413 [Pilaira anomala]|nr:hypothetical protein BD770DRAFT_440413 [Pilaira anomala]
MCQGTFFFGLWTLGHECGHLAFSPSKTINYFVRFIIHSTVLTSYYSWRHSHIKHHIGLGDMAKDPVTKIAKPLGYQF